MADTPKTHLLALAKNLDLSESYGVLLHLTALMESKPETLVPKNVGERIHWQGHLRGLHAALRCLVIHEQQCVPQKAGQMVDKHLAEAAVLLGQRDAQEAGSECRG